MNNLFEDFSHGPQSAPKPSRNDETLASYDAGYKAGWDDAKKAQQETAGHLSEALAANIERMEFSLIETRANILSTVQELLNEVVAKLLPSLHEQALGAQLKLELGNLIAASAADEVEIQVSPTERSVIAELLTSVSTPAGAVVKENTALQPGQLLVATTATQSKIDIPRLIEELAQSLQTISIPLETQEISNVG